MRAREFLMKDSYSFHSDVDCLKKTYKIMFDTYGEIFKEIGLDFRAVQADNGAIGGEGSHEFHVLADSGEDELFGKYEFDFLEAGELSLSLREKGFKEITRY